MTAPAEKFERSTDLVGFVLIISPIVTVATPMDLEALHTGKPHCFIGVQFFNDALGVTPATPTAGTVVVTIRTINTTPNFEAPPSPTIDATAPKTVTWAANTLSALTTPSGIVGATHYRSVVTCNET